MTREAVFRKAFETRVWGQFNETVSGYGSTYKVTERLRSQLPRLARALGVRTLLDAPCGDGAWMQKCPMPGVMRCGLDIVDEVIQIAVQRSSALLPSSERAYEQVFKHDIVEKPYVGMTFDLGIMKDLLLHLSLDDGRAALRNIASTCRYVLVSSSPGEENIPKETNEDWRYRDLERAPFDLPAPICRVGDGAQHHPLALWESAVVLDALR